MPSETGVSEANARRPGAASGGCGGLVGGWREGGRGGERRNAEVGRQDAEVGRKKTRSMTCEAH